MGITAHYIDVENVAMGEELLCFIKLNEDHSGEKIAEAIDACLKQLEIPYDKVIIAS